MKNLESLLKEPNFTKNLEEACNRIITRDKTLEVVTALSGLEILAELKEIKEILKNVSIKVETPADKTLEGIRRKKE